MRNAIRTRFLVVLSALFVLTSLFGQLQAESPLASDQWVIARVTAKTAAEAQRLVDLGLDLLEMREGDDLFILTTPEEIDRLRADGWAVSIDKEQTANVSRSTASFQGGYRTVEEVRAFVDAKAAQYPDLAEAFVYGSSWEKVASGGAGGHDLFGIRLTNRSIPGPKPTFFLMATIHAREIAVPELALRFIDHLLSNYGTDGDVTWLLDEHLIVVVPMVNPDGHIWAEQGYLQRKNTDTSYGGNCSVPNIGVDLNRNAEFKWGTVDKPTQSKCSETYPGPAPVSEPEISSLETLVRSLFPDQRGPADTDAAPSTATGIFITLHSYSNLVLWPWGWTANAAPNAADLSRIGQKFAFYNGFTPQQSIQLYPTSGTTDDWAYGELGIAAYTFEVGGSSGPCGGFFPVFSCLDSGTGGSFWPRNLPAFLYAARIARTPYQLGQGPSPESATATGDPASSIQIQARFDETANGGQAIVAAEYYVDVPPWRGGTATAMAPADGSFNGTVEVATAALGPLAERHLIFVRAQDSAGNWGPVRGVFTPDPGCTAALSPTSQSFTSAGGTDSVGVTLPAGCAWSATSNDSWITITGGASGDGDGAVSYSVAQNSGTAARAGSLTIAFQTFGVTQSGQVPPDLVETALSAPPAAALPGAAFSVTDTVQNQGPTSAGASTTRYYLSFDTAKDGADKLLTGTRAVASLASLAFSTGTVTVTIPSNTILGTYLLLACADDTGAVVETDDTNNCRASVSQVQVTRPDLLETAVTDPPAAALPGSSFPVTETAKNQGAVGSAASTTRFYLSLDTAKDAGDRLLSGARGVPALAANAFSTGTLNVTIPSTMALGSYYLLACSDDTGVVVETIESNNCKASANGVEVARPDLLATAVTDPPAATLPGAAFSLTDTVHNQGIVSAGASTVRYYLSADTTKGSGDRLLSGSRSVATLAAGALSPGTANVTIPSNTALGTYLLLACADDSTVVIETVESNNCKASTNTILVTRPDLTESAVSDPPASAARGTSFSATDTVLNVGPVSAGASTTRYYLSLDGSKGSGDKLLTGTRSVPTLASGGFSPGTKSVTIPTNTVLATYYLLACSDDTTVVTETNETNNCKASVNQVAVGP